MPPLKPRTDGARHRLYLFAGVMLVLLASAACWGAHRAWCALSERYFAQCRIIDTDEDVVIVIKGSAKMVHRDLVSVVFGLTNGANLAQIDFAGKRAELLKKAPSIRALTIERRMPNRITFEIFEREPIARVASASRRATINRVADTEGVVFRFHRSIAALPIIREAETPETPPGARLSGASAAALHLVQALNERADLGNFRVLEIDTSPKDGLLLTLGNYARAKIAWAHMGEEHAQARASLARQIERLACAFNSGITPGTTFWNAMDFDDKGRIYANDPTLSARQKGL
jgi:hypothetical protein